MKQLKYSVIVFSMALITTVLYAAGDVAVPEGDPLQTILALITNFKTMAPLAIASTAIVAIVQSARAFFPSSAIRKAVVIGLSVVYTAIQSILSGLGVVEAVILVLFTMGGATLLYNFVVKPLFMKKDPA